MTGKKYFYAMGQRARAMGLTKASAETKYTTGALAYASIYFDKGYRGLSI